MVSAHSYTIRVNGLDATIRGTRAFIPDIGRRVRAANLAFAGRVTPLVQQRYRETFPRSWSDRPSTGRSAWAGIRSAAGQNRSSIIIGGARFPYLPGQEFGSGSAKHAFTRFADVLGWSLRARDRTEARRFFAQFTPYTARRGRFLYPVVREAVPTMVEEYMELLDEALAEAFATGEAAA